ncbi:sialidase family protein [Plantactinospora sp. B5E13]|uniref:sialidase family protein n=1 Tax=unclassified Plantactinospora TaxID=2631981 RepID=UPI00325E3D3E
MRIRGGRVDAGRAGATIAVLALVGALLVGCSIGDVRRTPPAPVRSTGAGDGVPPVVERAVRVSVPASARLRQIEFVDADRGYALFVVGAADPAPTGAAEPDAPVSSGLLLGTVDGGRSWQPVRHPPLAGHPQLDAGFGLLVLSVGANVWYVSADHGRTFRRYDGERPPTAYHQLDGRFQICCEDDVRPKVVEWVGDRLHPVPAQPALPVLGSVGHGGDRLVAAGVSDGRPYVCVSADAGRSWQPAVPLGEDRSRSLVRAAVAQDGDAWLIGYADDRTLFPTLWRRDGPGEGWSLVRPVDPPERFTSAVPLGDGLLAVTGPDGPGLVGRGSYLHLPWPVGGAYLRMLPDGTLFAADPPTGRAWLGSGRGTERRWVTVRLHQG